MAVLLLRIAAPMQSWGDRSRFVRRDTCREPTKSGIVGLVASAQGRSREDAVSDLSELEFGVRIDQPGSLMRDFQTEHKADGSSLPLTNRYYLVDAVFLVALGGDSGSLRTVTDALLHPKRPLYLGRRSCPADLPLVRHLYENEDDVRAVLAREPWAAADWYKARAKSKGAPERLEIACDGRDGELCESRADYPLSFSGVGERKYAARPVWRGFVPNPEVQVDSANDADDAASSGGRFRSIPHDPMDF